MNSIGRIIPDWPTVGLSDLSRFAHTTLDFIQVFRFLYTLTSGFVVRHQQRFMAAGNLGELGER